MLDFHYVDLQQVNDIADYLKDQYMDEGWLNLLEGKNYSKLIYENVVGTKQIDTLQEIVVAEEFSHTMLTNFEEIPKCTTVIGDPGMGKTTVARKICQHWAENVHLNFISLLLYLPLSNCKKQVNIRNLQDLVKQIKFIQSPEQAKIIADFLKKSEGRDVVLILDGYSELSTKLPEESFIYKNLIKPRILIKARIIVTSRPSCLAALQCHSDKIIKILGFDQHSREQFINDVFQDSSEKQVALREHLARYPLDSRSYVPLDLAIMTYLCRMGRLPDSIAKFHECFVVHIVSHHLKNLSEYTQPIEQISEFPLWIRVTLTHLQKIASDNLENDQMEFTLPEKELSFYKYGKDNPCFGVLETIKGETTTSYRFLNAGIQNYFAAKYMSELPDDEISDYLKQSFLRDPADCKKSKKRNKITSFSNMWVLFFGITNGHSDAIQKYIYKKDGKKIKKRLHKNPQSILSLFHCFQEAGNDDMCDMLVSQISNDGIFLQEKQLYSHQLVSLGFFLSHSKRRLNILNLSFCKISDSDMLILQKHACANEKIEGIEKIYLKSNTLTEQSSQYIKDLLKYFKPKCLDLSNNNIAEHGIDDIILGLQAAPIECLILESVDFVKNNLQHMHSILIQLKVLNIARNNISLFDAEVIANLIKYTQTLQELIMDHNPIEKKESEAIAEAIEINKTLIHLSIYGEEIPKSIGLNIVQGIHKNNTILYIYICESKRIKNEVRDINEKRRSKSKLTLVFKHKEEHWKVMI